MARVYAFCYDRAMKLIRIFAPGIILLSLIALSGCENMNGVRQSLEDLNKVLTPLAVIKIGSGS